MDEAIAYCQRPGTDPGSPGPQQPRVTSDGARWTRPWPASRAIESTSASPHNEELGVRAGVDGRGLLQGHRPRPENPRPWCATHDVKRDYDGASCFCKAVDLNRRTPKFSARQCTERGPSSPATTRRRLDPKHALAHNNLGIARGKGGGRVACYNRPSSASTHARNLGLAAKDKGQVDGPSPATRRPSNRPEQPPTELAKLERLAAWDKLAPTRTAATAGQHHGTPAWSSSARSKLHRGRRPNTPPPAATPKLADNLGRSPSTRLLRSTPPPPGGGTRQLDDRSTRLRRQTLDCLRADLALCSKQLDTGSPADRAGVQQKLRHWQQDADLDGLRDSAALAKLPADEQKAFTQLWADVAALVKKAEVPTAKEGKP